jgi:hypothetical protein
MTTVQRMTIATPATGKKMPEQKIIRLEKLIEAS